MKTRRKVKAPKTTRSAWGMRILAEDDSQNKSQADAILRQNSMKEAQLREYYQEGEVYAFTICSCISDTNPDGTQKTKYTVKDKHGDKHYHHCDCTCFEIGKEVYLRIDKIIKGQLKFENSIIEHLDEIFIKGKEYEFEVHNYKNGRYAVRDKQIGKNHYLKETNSSLYQKLQELKLEVQDYDNEGNLVLIDRNPPTPTPCLNALQHLLTENEEKSQKCETQQEPRIEGFQTSALDQTNQPSLSDIPKAAQNIPTQKDKKSVPVEPLAASHKEKRHTQQKQPKETESAGKAQATKQEKSTADEAESLYQQGKSAEEKGNKKGARKLYQQAADLGHMGAKGALGKLYLEKALKLIKQAADNGNSGAQALLTKILSQIINQEKGSTADNRSAPRQIDRVPRKKRAGALDTALTDLTALVADCVQATHSGSEATENELIHVDLTQTPEKPEYYVWIRKGTPVLEADIELDSVAISPTESKCSDATSTTWESEPVPECGETDGSGCEIPDSEIQHIDFSTKRPGCIFCRFIHWIKNLFSQITKR